MITRTASSVALALIVHAPRTRMTPLVRRRPRRNAPNRSVTHTYCEGFSVAIKDGRPGFPERGNRRRLLHLHTYRPQTKLPHLLRDGDVGLSLDDAINTCVGESFGSVFRRPPRGARRRSALFFERRSGLGFSTATSVYFVWRFRSGRSSSSGITVSLFTSGSNFSSRRHTGQRYTTCGRGWSSVSL